MDFDSFEDLLAYYTPPFKPRADQENAVLSMFGFDRIGLFDEVGTGKTLVSTYIALAWDSKHVVVLAPPILLLQWATWLRSIRNAGPVVIYAGTPKQRQAIKIEEHRWLLMSIQIFKKDYRRIQDALAYAKQDVSGIVDEATSIKNCESGNFKHVNQFFVLHQRKLMLLTATPVNTPRDAYAYTKLKTPAVYRSYNQFLGLHTAEVDFFGNITKWRDLDVMRSNLMLQSSRRLKNEVLAHLHLPNYINFDYELDKSHYALYKELMDTQVLELPDGGKIDATAASAMYSKSQQIVCNWSHFSQNPENRSRIYDYIDYVIEEAGIMDYMEDGELKTHPQTGSPRVSKLMIFTYFKMTSRGVVEYLRAKYPNAPASLVAAAYSEVTGAEQRRGFEAFMNDPHCRFFVAQPSSGGYGLNAQKVCWETLVAEIPTNPQHFVQLVGRSYRDGQENVPNIRLACAKGTIQVALRANLLKNDALAYEVQGGVEKLKDAIFGR